MKKNFSYILILILFFCSGAVSWNLYFKEYSQKDTVDINKFPKIIGEWTSKEVPISEGDYAILETRNAFIRNYTNVAGEKVQIFIVYSQNNRKVSHPPELCYTGSGARVLSNVPATIPLQNAKAIEGNRVLVERGRTQQVLYYWFKVGDSFTGNYWKQQILIGLKTLTGKPASSALIRLSSTIKNGKTEKEALDIIKKFVPAIIPYIPTYLP